MAAVAAGGAASAEHPGDTASPRPPVYRLIRANFFAVIIATAVLATAAVLAVTDPWLMSALLVLAPIAAVAAVLDARYQRIPTSLTIAATGIGMVSFGLAAIVTGAGTAFGRALAAVVIVVAVHLVLWRFASMGRGDVRLAGALALFAGWAGWSSVAAFIVLPFLVMLPFAVWRLIRGPRGHVPFGPAIVAGLYLAVALTLVAT